MITPLLPVYVYHQTFISDLLLLVFSRSMISCTDVFDSLELWFKLRIGINLLLLFYTSYNSLNITSNFQQVGYLSMISRYQAGSMFLALITLLARLHLVYNLLLTSQCLNNNKLETDRLLRSSNKLYISYCK